jgi:4-hydroxy-3-methylbut-2-enyl diphosphate reductase
MKVYLAEQAGFCLGVKRALDLINQLYNEGQDIQIYGQLIHNQTVLDDLKKKGIECIESMVELDGNKTLVIRSHGVPVDVENHLIKNKINYVDATCPLVKKTHNIINELNLKSSRIIIVGDEKHPEIIAARSYSKNSIVINSEKEASALKNNSTISMLGQTTLNSDLFKKIVSVMIDKVEKLEVYNTICKATKVRQEAIKKLAPKVDCAVVIGGKNSSNTRKLFEISKDKNTNTFFVEKSSDLDNPDFIKKLKMFQSVGITAGASTPPDEIERVEKFLKNLNIGKESKHGETKRHSEH